MTLFDLSKSPQDASPHEAHTQADIVIVGSGYGGSVAAEKLARQAQAWGRKSADGSVAPLRVILLERGREYLPGEFPEDISEVPSQIRINRVQGGVDIGYADSLIQVFPADDRSDSSVSVVVGTALGGGSQINAGVTRRPHPSVFENPRWPVELRGKNSARLERHFAAVIQGLDAKPLPERFNPRKLQALHVLHGQLHQPTGLPEGYQAHFERPAIAVNFETFPNGINPSGVAQPECIHCGNCASGCNTGAKNTLTANYLPRARAAGAEIYTEALVANMTRRDDDAGYQLTVVPVSSIDAEDHVRTLLIDARIVILAAGALGSTEILLRSEALKGDLSDRLGECFSTNGDSIGARFNGHQPVNSMGKGLAVKDLPIDERPGPTITGAILLSPDGPRQGKDGLPLPTFTVEDCAIPLAIADAGAELVTSAAMLRLMTQSPLGKKAEKDAGKNRNRLADPLGTNPDAIAHTAFYLSMARDSAAGKIILADARRPGGLGHARISWPLDSPEAREVPQNGRNLRMLDDILAGPQHLGGVYVPNPAREPVPPAIASMMSHMPQGSAMTVHPLGGCPMGNDAGEGVVDFRGRVFNRRDGGVFAGLYVLDGSIIPCAVETNPFLTIAGLTHMAIEEMIAIDLPGLLGKPLPLSEPSPGQAQSMSPSPALQPPLKRPAPLLPAPVIRREIKTQEVTRFKFKERLRQKLLSPEGLESIFDLKGITAEAYAQGLIYLEIWFSYEPADLSQFLKGPEHDCELQGHVRVVRRRLAFPAFSEQDWEPLTPDQPLFEGHIALFRSTVAPSYSEGLRAFGVFNERRSQRESALDGKADLRSRFKALTIPSINFFSHIGAAREVAYTFKTRTATGKIVQWSGRKDIRYRLDSQVWKDLFTLPLSVREGHRRIWSGRPSVDIDYFLGEGVPSVQSQRSLPDAIMSLGSYAMLYLRVILHTYFYEFGPPDYPEQASSGMPLPGPLELAGQRVIPQKYWLPVAGYGRLQKLARTPGEDVRAAGRAFEASLSQLDPRPHAPASAEYCLISAYLSPAKVLKPSVLLIHGYAISSSMWASPRIGKNMVQSLLEAGHDVYVADLRTSSALTEIRDQAVGYDQVAEEDIPCAIEFVWQKQKQRLQAQPGVDPEAQGIHLVAHCMGSAQTSMALLSQQQSHDEGSLWHHLQSRFIMSKNRIAKACFFQVAPMMAVTRANAVRGRAAAVFDALVRRQTVSPWLKAGNRTSTLEALLDRFAMTFPYPGDRNPGSPEPLEKSPWVGVTRKAFWLYGETWDNANLNDDTIRHIDEMIGPVNVATYRQVGAFTRCGRLVDAVGANDYVKDRYLANTFQDFESLWLHGERSGMFEKQTTAGTVARLKLLLEGQQKSHLLHFQSLPGFGHLDSLIGDQAHLHGHKHVVDFLAGARPAMGPESGSVLKPYLDALRASVPSAPSATGHARSPSLNKPAGALPYRAATGGPFFTRTSGANLRVWFFAEAPLGDRLLNAVVAIARQSRGPGHPVPHPAWEVSLAWSLPQGRRYAALRHYVLDIPEALLQAGDRIVVAGHFTSSLDDLQRFSRSSVRNIRTAQGFAETNGRTLDAITRSLPELMQAGSFVSPGQSEDAQQASRCFMLGSCQYSGWMIDKSWSKKAHDAWLAFARQHRPEALVLMGDQVYLDALGNVVSDSPRADNLARMYLEAFGGNTGKQSSWLQLLRQSSLHCVMDDHEFTDNFSADSGFSGPSFDVAFKAFALFQGPSLPTYKVSADLDELGLDTGDDAVFSGASTLCGCPAFYLDTRIHRKRSTDQLFGSGDMEQFKSWAQSIDKAEPKFIITGSVFMPVLAATLAQPSARLDDDTINGYPQARNEMLEVIAQAGLSNIIFLSGDLHLSTWGKGVLKSAQGDLTFAFVVASGLYTPMPFANARSWALPEPGKLQHLSIAAAHVSEAQFTVHGVSEEQSIGHISVQREAAGMSVRLQTIGRSGETLLAGDLL